MGLLALAVTSPGDKPPGITAGRFTLQSIGRLVQRSAGSYSRVSQTRHNVDYDPVEFEDCRVIQNYIGIREIPIISL